MNQRNKNGESRCEWEIRQGVGVWRLIPDPSPCTMLKTPLGRPHSSKISARAVAVRGVISDGLATIALPHANAGATINTAYIYIIRRKLIAVSCLAMSQVQDIGKA